MHLYFLIAKNTWDEILTYRLNFVMWRVRTVLSLLTTYFLWLSLIPSTHQLFGYTQSLMLTYILSSFFFSSLVFSTRTQEIGDNINSGNLSIFLIRPFNYFAYWLFRDIGDKVMNIFFSFFELAILFLILHPPFFIQTNGLYLLFSVIALFCAIILSFLFGCLLGMIGFWSAEVWAPRFIFYILLTFFTGMLFPLDILPKPLFTIFQLLPFPYLLYFPLKIYLGQLTGFQISIGILVSLSWIVILFSVLKTVWLKGLKQYASYGR